MRKTVLWPVLVLTLLLVIWAEGQRAGASGSQVSSNQASGSAAGGQPSPQVTTRAYSFDNDAGLTQLNDFLGKYPSAKAVAVTVDPKMNRIILVVEIRQ